MAKSLKNLIRVHKYHVDEKRRILGALFDELNALEQRRNDLDYQVEEEKRIAREAPMETMFSYGSFHKKAMQMREEMTQQIDLKMHEVEEAQDAVNEAFRELKVYEQAEKNRIEREKAEQTRKENIEMDEIAMTLHRRRDL